MTALTKTITALQPQWWNGKKIAMPGVYNDIPLEDYHGDICVEPSISSSSLRALYSPLPWVKASPAHYWCKSPYNPARTVDDDEEEKKAFILGRAAHHLLFGEAEFKKVFALRPLTINGEAWHGSKTICKLWLKKQTDLKLTVLTPDHLKAVKGIARELAKDPLVRNGLLNGLIEHSWFWKHRSGIWLKIRPDATPKDSLDFVDLKLSRSIMWPDMQRAIRDYGYYMQAGLTAMGVRAVLGQPLNSYTLVFAENTEPHCIEIVTLKENEIARGIEACENAITLFVKCMQEKRWPGPRGDREDAQYIELNEFDQTRIDETIALDRKG
jgi:PDDEXK-like domain of unknown function (DUF3799)